MFLRTRSISLPWTLVLAGFLATQQFASIPRFLCVETDGHMEIETMLPVFASAVGPVASGPVPACATDGCGPCTDVVLEMPLHATSRPLDDTEGLQAPLPAVSAVAVAPEVGVRLPDESVRCRPAAIPASACADGRVPFLLL